MSEEDGCLPEVAMSHRKNDRRGEDPKQDDSEGVRLQGNVNVKCQPQNQMST